MNSKQPEKWQVLAREVVMHDAFLAIEIQQLPNGTIIDNWSIIDAHDYAMIVAENEAGELLILDG